jgi:nucleoside-diphosphate-sugar epimerase
MMPERAKEAVVTGATGFVGIHLVKRLLSDGWIVHAIVRPSSGIEHVQSLESSIRFHVHDGTVEGMMAIFERIKPSVVFHLASYFKVEHTTQDIAKLAESNMHFGLQLLEAMVSHDVLCLVNTGTSWQHYNNEDYNPVNLYAATKQAFESLMMYYIRARELKSITLKLFDTYGPDDNRPKLFALLREAGENQLELEMSQGEQLLDIVYIDDVIEAFAMAASRLSRDESRPFEEYAVSSGKPLPLREIVEIYQKVTGKVLAIKWGGRPYRTREVMVPWSRGKCLKGWSPKISLEQGINLVHNRTA